MSLERPETESPYSCADLSAEFWSASSWLMKVTSSRGLTCC
jgi:hypothetical protein